MDIAICQVNKVWNLLIGEKKTERYYCTYTFIWWMINQCIHQSGTTVLDDQEILFALRIGKPYESVGPILINSSNSNLVSKLFLWEPKTIYGLNLTVVMFLLIEKKREIFLFKQEKERPERDNLSSTMAITSKI